MSFTLTSLCFRDFRNYGELVLSDIGPITILVGPNAVGKTNVVEGIQLLTSFSSFRHQPLDYLIREGGAQAYLRADMEDGARKLDTELVIQPGKKQFRRNGKPKRAADMQGTTSSVVFTPDDLEVIKGSHSQRRDAVDLLGCQISKNYATVKRDVDDVLRQKGRMLKEESPRGLIESINDVLVTCGAQLTCYREALIERMMPYLVENYRTITQTKESVSLGYIESWKAVGEHRGHHYEVTSLEGVLDTQWHPVAQDEAREQLSRALELSLGDEMMRRRCLVGPQSDHLDFYIGGKHAGYFGSQGQQRSVVLAWKLSEVALIEEMTGNRPIVLLDDVMSELDKSRRDALVNLIREGMQVVITTTNLSYFTDDLLAFSRPIELPFPNVS